MTIAAGALWPWWGEAGMPSPPVRGLRPQAAILVCDSRWTIKGGKAVWHEDTAQKMFQIARNAGAVYAGHAEAGEEALNRLAARFSKGRAKKDQLGMARGLFKAVYDRHNTTEPLRIILGHCDPAGFAGLTYFGAENGFAPEPVEGVSVIAFSESEEAFRHGLAEVIKETVWGGKGGRFSPDNAALSVGIAMYNFVIEPGQDSTVGGGVQLGMVTHEGFKKLAMVTNRAPTEKSGWRRIAPAPGELRTRKPRMRKA